MNTTCLCRRLRPLLALLLLCTWGCATNPVTKKRELSWHGEGWEIQTGRANYAAYQQMEGGEYVNDPPLQQYVHSVAEKIWSESDRPHLPFEIVVLNSSVPNAWAMPGGKMAINRGLLTELNCESELAAVLGHEIVHVCARHGAKSTQLGEIFQIGLLGAGLALEDHKHRDVILGGTGLAAGLVSLKYSRGDETEADQYGIKYMAQAGYDVQSAVTLQELFMRLSGDPNWMMGLFSSHPASRDRVEANRATIRNYPAGGFRGCDEYARAVANLKKVAPAYEKLDEGQAALANRDAAKALACARAAQAIEPREGHFHALEAMALAQQTKFPQALESLNHAIKLNPGYFEYYLDRGRLRYAMNAPGQARPDLERSVQLLPTAQAHYLLGVLDLDGGATADARKHFRIAAESDSDEGQKAGTLLAKLEIGEAPERYLSVSYALDRAGYLVVTIANNSPVDVGTCVVGLAPTPPGRWSSHAFEGGVPARRAASLKTPLGPFTSLQQAQESVGFRFEDVQVAP